MSKMYMAVTADKYELPQCLRDSADDLARAAGLSNRAVYYYAQERRTIKRGWLKGCRIVRVEVEDD